MSSQKDVGLDSGSSIFCLRAGSSEIIEPREAVSEFKRTGLRQGERLDKGSPYVPDRKHNPGTLVADAAALYNIDNSVNVWFP